MVINLYIVFQKTKYKSINNNNNKKLPIIIVPLSAKVDVSFTVIVVKVAALVAAVVKFAEDGHKRSKHVLKKKTQKLYTFVLFLKI